MLRHFSLLVFSFLVLSACSASNSNNPSTQDFARPSVTLERPPIRGSLVEGTEAAPSGDVAGKFIFAPGDGSIWVQDPVKGRPNPVIRPSPELFADAPSWAPDGKTFVYVRSSLTAQGSAQSAIYRANVDGTQNEPVLTPPNNKTTFNWPHYSWDGKWVYYTASSPVPPNKQNSTIQRIAVGGSAPQKIIDDARMSTESPDGKKSRSFVLILIPSPPHYGLQIWTDKTRASW